MAWGRRHASQQLNIKLVAVAKDEGAYLGEWIFHHLYIGIDEIEIWLNNCGDNSSSILSTISKHEPRVKLVEATSLFRLCASADVGFQQSAYEMAFQTARASKLNTHIIYLDLDEYLIGPSPKSNIKDLISTYKDAAVISFRWQSDSPLTGNKKFSKAIKSRMTTYKMNHVKFLAQLDNPQIKGPAYHNFYVRNEDNIKNILADGSLLNKANSMKGRQVLASDFRENQDNASANWFVLHTVYRSKAEYCATLIRGNCSGKDNIPIGNQYALKENRWGYVLPGELATLSLVEWSPSSFKAYKQARGRFFRIPNLKTLTKEARSHLLRQHKRLKKILRKDPSIVSRHPRPFRGTRYEGFGQVNRSNS